jgi:YhcH/YjgK/YiaL family protein
MIHDQLSNALIYGFSNPRLQKGLDFLRSSRAAGLPVGRVDLEGDRLFAMMQEYPTRVEKDCTWEAHQRYIDIQCVVSGVEEIRYAPITTLQIVEPYNPEQDFTKLEGTGAILRFHAGTFAIFFPHDAHKPCMAPGGVAGPVKKIVVKVAV